jgi:DNA-binding NarL/FixJ family response regulator
MPRLLLIGPDYNLRRAIDLVLRAEPDFEVAGLVPDLGSAPVLIAVLRPDALVLDAGAALGQAAHLTHSLRRTFRDLPVIVLHDGEQPADPKPEPGTTIWLSKGEASQALVCTIRRLLDRKRLLEEVPESTTPGHV